MNIKSKADNHPARVPNLSQTAVKLLTAGRIMCFVLLFLAVLGAPLYKSALGGISGSTAVWRISLVLGLLTAADCWLRSIGRPDKGDCDEIPEFSIWGSRWPQLLLLCTFLLCINLFVVNLRNPKSWGLVTGNDQPQYYSYLHSWVFDRDLDFENEYRMMPGILEVMRTGHPEDPAHNVAPVGTPVLWMPFYLSAHMGVYLLRLAGNDVPADGISSPYAAGVAFGSIFLAWVGMLLVYKTLSNRFSDRAAFFSTILLWLATPLLWYLTDEVWMSHACSFFSAAVVFRLWDKHREKRPMSMWAALGAAIGLAMLVRPSHIALFVLPIADTVTRIHTQKQIVKPVRALGLCTACMLAAFIPQLAVWWLRTGFHVPSGNPMQWSHPAIVKILFSAHHGLFAWHPVTLLGFVGVVFLWKRSRHLAVCIGLVLLLNLYLNASVESWYGGTSFGMRRFIGSLPFMAPSLAAVGSSAVDSLRKRPSVPVAICVLALFLYNSMLAVIFREHWIHPSDPVAFRNVWVTQATVFHQSFGNPFSYPANLWFAAKHAVSPAQYDELGGALPGKEKRISAEGSGLRAYLGFGWQTDTKASFGPDVSFMATERRCSLLLPIREGVAYLVEMQIALPKHSAKEPSVSLRLNGRQVGVADLRTDKPVNLKVKLEEEVTQDGVNELELAFTHLRSQPWPDRTPMQGGKGLEVGPIQPFTCAAFLTRLSVTPIAE